MNGKQDIIEGNQAFTIEGNLADMEVGLDMLLDMLQEITSDESERRRGAQAKMFFVLDALKGKLKQTEDAFVRVAA